MSSNSNSARYLMHRYRNKPNSDLLPLPFRARSRCEHKLTICLECAKQWTEECEIHWYRTVAGRSLAASLGISERNLGNLSKDSVVVKSSEFTPSISWTSAVDTSLDGLIKRTGLRDGDSYYEREITYGPWIKKTLP